MIAPEPLVTIVTFRPEPLPTILVVGKFARVAPVGKFSPALVTVVVPTCEPLPTTKACVFGRAPAIFLPSSIMESRVVEVVIPRVAVLGNVVIGFEGRGATYPLLSLRVGVVKNAVPVDSTNFAL